MIEVIPAIDIIDGQCVRLTKGDYSTKKSYSSDIVSLAKEYESIGIRKLHIVDLDGAKASFPKNLDNLKKIAEATNLDIQFGGGIKSSEALKAVFDSGASRAICGSVAVTQPEIMCDWLREYGTERVILGADIRDGFVATHGWLEDSAFSVDDLIERFIPYGVSQVICTDISRDGTLQGPSFALYERLQGKYNVINITASGGISSINDIQKANELGLRSVIVGKAIYEGMITLNNIKEWLQRE